MCHTSCLNFGRDHLTPQNVKGMDVLEVGSYNVNGSLRDYVTTLDPARYLGLDVEQGPGVDEIGNVEELEERFGTEAFDVVICTEMLEHVPDWKFAITNLKRVVRKGGTLLITTRSKGFGYHGFPGDYWRFEVGDFTTIFQDFEIDALIPDPEAAGVFIKATKPILYKEHDISSYSVYSMPQPDLSSLTMQVFWDKEGLFTESQSATVDYLADNKFFEVQFEIPSYSGGAVRFDPCNLPSYVEISRFRLFRVSDLVKVEIASWPNKQRFADLEIRGKAACIDREDRLELLCFDNDPQIIARLPHLESDIRALLWITMRASHRALEDVRQAMG